MQTQTLKGNVKRNTHVAVDLIRRGELVAFLIKKYIDLELMLSDNDST